MADKVSRRRVLALAGQAGVLSTLSNVAGHRARSSEAPLTAGKAPEQGATYARPVKNYLVDVYVSSGAGDRLQKNARIAFEQAGSDVTHFRVDEHVKFQKMLGFGASFLEAGAISLNSLNPKTQEEVLRMLFDRKDGAGFSAMKTVIATTDFMSAGPQYSYSETSGDLEHHDFSIARDLRPNGLATFIKRARRYGDFILQATMDYPPDWMLADVNDRARQTIAPKFYDSLSLYYLKYLQAYEQHGITIDYLSPFNEPGAYSKVSYEQIRDLIKDHLGPLLAKSGTKTRLQVSDAPFRAHARYGIPTIMIDPRARQYIASLSYHGYDYRFRTSAGQSMSKIGSASDLRDAEPTAKDGYRFQEFRNIEQLHAMYPELPLWMTEVCYFDMEHADRKPWQPPLPRYDFDDGDFWGLQIAADMAAGASGWTYWNMILDQHGGPNLVSPSHNDPARNVQHPVVIINRETGKVTYTGLYYYLAHFSRFVRPGAHRISVDGEVDGITMLGFEGPDRRIIIEAINSRNTPANLTLGWHDGVLHLQMPARSISTYTWSEPQET